MKPSTVMENCPSMDKKSSPRPLRAGGNQVRRRQASQEGGSVICNGFLEAIWRIVINSLLFQLVDPFLKLCLGTRGRGGPPCIPIGDPLCRHFAYHRVTRECFPHQSQSPLWTIALQKILELKGHGQWQMERRTLQV